MINRLLITFVLLGTITGSGLPAGGSTKAVLAARRRNVDCSSVKDPYRYRLTNPEGWEIPAIYAKDFEEQQEWTVEDVPVSVKIYTPINSPENQRQYFDQIICQKVDGKIEAVKESFMVHTIVTYERNGKIYDIRVRYVSLNGLQMYPSIYFRDKDGDGIFETLKCGLDDKDKELPDWVKKLK